MAVHVPALPRPDLWHRRFGPTFALFLVVVPFAVILVWAAISATVVDEDDVATTLTDTAVVVDAHARAMIDIGQRVTAAAQASTASGRMSWIAYGQHMVSDGQSLQALSTRLREDAAVAAADPLHTGRNIPVAALRAKFEQLKADGRATAEHGRVMQSMAIEMSSGISSGIITSTEAQAIQEASTGMVDAGEQMVSMANVLLAKCDQVQRWMGTQ